MAIIGAIIGDIVGSKYESNRALYPYKCELFTEDNKFTDDTVMTLAIKNALDNNISPDKAMRDLGNKYLYCGYGKNFRDWLINDWKGPYNSYGNGSAMRTSYVAEYYDNQDVIIKKAGQIASFTHNHPEGIKGAIVTSVCIWMARHRKSKEEIYNYAIHYYPREDYLYGGDLSLTWLQKNYRWDVSCMGSVPVAMRCFYESDSYESFLRNVLSLDCDTDTLCAIGGAVAEEYYGTTGFDNKRILNRYLDEYLLDILNI